MLRPGGTDAGRLVGRAGELGRIRALLDRARAGRGGALVLEGPPGVGKSALLRALEAPDLQLLSTTGVESEIGLPFAGLAELVAPLLGHADGLPEAQRAALRAALAIDAPAGAEQVLVLHALVALLEAAGATRPLLLLVDDVQWLDASTQEAVAFLARRAPRLPLALVVVRSLRGEPYEPWPEVARMRAGGSAAAGCAGAGAGRRGVGGGRGGARRRGRRQPARADRGARRADRRPAATAAPRCPTRCRPASACGAPMRIASRRCRSRPGLRCCWPPRAAAARPTRCCARLTQTAARLARIAARVTQIAARVTAQQLAARVTQMVRRSASTCSNRPRRPGWSCSTGRGCGSCIRSCGRRSITLPRPGDGGRRIGRWRRSGRRRSGPGTSRSPPPRPTSSSRRRSRRSATRRASAARRRPRSGCWSGRRSSAPSRPRRPRARSPPPAPRPSPASRRGRGR